MQSIHSLKVCFTYLELGNDIQYEAPTGKGQGPFDHETLELPYFLNCSLSCYAC